MSKLSPALKELINAPAARPGPAAAPAGIANLYGRIASEAHARNIGPRPWVTLCAAATFTLNSAASLGVLHATASDANAQTHRAMGAVAAAELVREVGLKSISFNGIPRSINGLAAFWAGLGAAERAGLATGPTRALTPANLPRRAAAGRALWASVYVPFEHSLLARLAASHPDLPVHILDCHYAALLSEPDSPDPAPGPSTSSTSSSSSSSTSSPPGLARLGRVLTSLVAIACLRAQTGVGPQVLSHVFGLRKAVEQGLHLHEAEDEAEKRGMEWLASDDGGQWILRNVDHIAEAIGYNFAAKL